MPAPRVVSSEPQKTTGVRPPVAPKPVSPAVRRARRAKRKADRQERQADQAAKLAQQQETKEVNDAVELQFGPVTRNLIRQRRASQQQQVNSDQWYSDYQATVRAQQQAAAQAFAGAQANQQVQAASQQAQSVNQNVANTAAMQQDAANRGATVDPGLAATAAQAAQARLGPANSFGALLASQGANAQGLLGSKEVAGAAAKLSSRRDEAGRRRGINEDLEDLARQKGAYKTKYLGDKTAAEQKAALETAVFNQDVHESKSKEQLELLKLQAQLRQSRVTAKQKAAADASDVNQWGYTKAEWTGMSSGQRESIIKVQKGYGKTPKDSRSGGKDRFGNTPQQRRTNRNQWDTALEFFRDHPAFITAPGGLTMVRQETGAAYDIAQAALHWAQNDGTLDARRWRNMRRLGIKVSPEHREKKTPARKGPQGLPG